MYEKILMERSSLKNTSIHESLHLLTELPLMRRTLEDDGDFPMYILHLGSFFDHLELSYEYRTMAKSMCKRLNRVIRSRGDSSMRSRA